MQRSEKPLIKILKAKSITEIWESLEKTFSLRVKRFSTSIETCAILNAKSGKCPSDCKFCAQSAKFNLPIQTYPLLDKEKLIKNALEAFDTGIDRFSFVTSGVSPTDKELYTIGQAIEEIVSKNPQAKMCASLGQLNEKQLSFLKSCGLKRYHHNLETSKEFYPSIASYQKWEDRFQTAINVKNAGLELCCGGIFGIGETPEDILSLAHTLKELKAESIPVNFLHPIPGTPLENANNLTPLKCLAILIILRIALPDAEMRVCGGREYNLQELQPFALLPASGLMVGNYLTTKGRGLEKDAQLIKLLGFKSNLKV